MGDQLKRSFIQTAKRVKETAILTFWECLTGRAKEKKKKKKKTKSVDCFGGSFDKSLGFQKLGLCII